MLGVGIVAITSSVVALTYYLYQPQLAELQSERYRTVDSGDLPADDSTQNSPIFALIDRVMGTFGWRPYSEEDLAAASIKQTPTAMVAITIIAAIGGLIVGLGLADSLLLGIVLAALAPAAIKFSIKIKTDRRRDAFQKQMSEAMQLFSSGLKAGMNVPTALATVGSELDAPMGEEVTRIVNETRLGKDLVVAMREAAARMDSSDFLWVTEAIAIQRESGGRLSEILDRVTSTIAERNEINMKIRSLSAEGRMSGYVLMALPVLIGVFYAFASPGYMDPLFQTFIGQVLLAVSAVLYVVGGWWLRAMTKVTV